MLGPWLLLFQSLINIFGLHYEPTLLTLHIKKPNLKKERKKEVEEEDEDEEIIFTPLWTNLCLWHMSACNH